MDFTYTSKHNGGQSDRQRLLLLLLSCLTGLQAVLSTVGEESSENEALQVVIVGPDYVTVNVPSSVECDANCGSLCTYSMALDGQRAQGQGNVLAFTLTQWVNTLTLTCTVTNDQTGKTAMTTKTLQVLAGPTNISISGPDVMKPTVSHTYSCHAYCRPSCNYTWKFDQGPWVRGLGSVISINPQEMKESKMLICKATNSVSGLFAAATQNIAIISGPTDVQINGPDFIEVATEYEFVCSADCYPPCHYVISADSQTVRGNEIEMTVDHPVKSVTLKCEAQNTVSKKSATVFKTLRMEDRNTSTRPEDSLAVLLLAFIASVSTP
ncbi:uncharacterized protein LOC117504086 [Thalassophryne amazonica]|uniref:uncharacterized protein LOC117504086 n=1 Tax=Thalassophryne amazonica TaxID=390379 RepID=UPI0014718FD7|nr:uncharacterized protein LOC117504086 [Thalassophryne amazonica]